MNEGIIIWSCCQDLELEGRTCRKGDFAKLRTKKTKIDAESARKETHIACGVGVVVAKNVLLFLQSE